MIPLPPKTKKRKKLYKKTDLGYFAGLAMQSLISLNYPMNAEY